MDPVCLRETGLQRWGWSSAAIAETSRQHGSMAVGPSHYRDSNPSPSPSPLGWSRSCHLHRFHQPASPCPSSFVRSVESTRRLSVRGYESTTSRADGANAQWRLPPTHDERAIGIGTGTSVCLWARRFSPVAPVRTAQSGLR